MKVLLPTSMLLALACGNGPLSAPPPPTAAADLPDAPPFACRLELAASGKPLGVLAWNADEDPALELIAATRSPGAVLCWRDVRAALVSAEAPLEIPIGDYPVGPVATRDGFAVASRSTRELSWFDRESLAAGRPARTVQLETAPRVLVAGDVDDDGEEELCALTKENEILVAHRDGTVEKTFTGHDQPCCATVLSDGRLAIGFQVGRELCVYRRDASEARGWAVEWQAGFDGVPRALREVDCDGDGDLELVVSGGDSSHWVLGLDAPGGARAWIDPDVVEPTRLEWGSIPIDLATADLGLLALAFFESSWAAFSGNPPRRTLGGYAGQAPVALTAGDLDGDGHTDVAIANSDARRVSVLLGDGSGGVRVAPEARTGKGPTHVCAVNLDGEPGQEVVALNALENSYSVVSWNGGAPRSAPARPAGNDTSAVACADLNGDARADLVVLRRGAGGGSVSVRHGDGAGSFASEALTLDLGTSAADVLAHDFDGDGRAELIVADPDGDALHQVLERDGALVLVHTLEVPSGPRALSLLPVGGTSPEVAVALGGPGPRTGVARVRVSAAGLSEVGYFETTATPLDLATADLDGAGGYDLALLAHDRGRDGPGLYVPLVSSGDGWRELAGQRAGLRSYAIAAGDVDGNGLSDVFVSAQNSHHVNWWLSFATDGPAAIRQPDLGFATGPLGLCIGDVDGNGKLDLVCANAFANTVGIAVQ